MIKMVDHTVQVHQGGSDEVREGGKGQTDRKQGGIKGINSESEEQVKWEKADGKDKGLDRGKGISEITTSEARVPEYGHWVGCWGGVGGKVTETKEMGNNDEDARLVPNMGTAQARRSKENRT